MRIVSFIGLVLAVSVGQAAIAQTVAINEIYASHSGIDDMEFIELKGTPLFKLDNYMILIVEGDGTNAGILDRAWDLKGYSIPVDGYWVFGDAMVPNVDVVKGVSGTGSTIENGTETFYLVNAGSAANVARIVALVGTKVEDPNYPNLTTIPTLATIVDIIAMVDTGITASDKTYDGAKNLGPDGTFFPAGVYRAADVNWCDTGWLDFDDVANTNAPSTSGTKNTTYCGKATIAAKGKSCLTGPGSAGGPVLTATIPSIGNSFDSTVTGVGGGAIGFLYLGVEGGPTPFLGCSIHINTAALIIVGAFTITATTGELKVPVPYTVSLLGSKFATQAAIGTATTLHLTNALLGQIGY